MMDAQLADSDLKNINEALQDLTLGQDHDVEESKEQIATLDWSLAESVIS
jgi:hypothetical protein